jgi:hypothetical protein
MWSLTVKVWSVVALSIGNRVPDPAPIHIFRIMARVRLVLLAILRDTFLLPLRVGSAFVKPLALPGLVMALITVGWYLTDAVLPGALRWALYGFHGIIFTVFAVTCHRIVLLGLASRSADVLTVTWSMRETRFLMWIVLTYGAYVAVWVACFTVIGMLVGTIALAATKGVPGREVLQAPWLRWISYLVYLPAMYCFSRLSLVLPATAIDRKMNLKEAWRLSEGNGWRLVVIVGVLPWMFSYLLGGIFRENATWPEVVGVMTLLVVTSAFGIVALSLSYWAVTADSTATTPQSDR